MNATYRRPISGPPAPTRPVHAAFLASRPVSLSARGRISFRTFVVATAHIAPSHSRSASHRTLQQQQQQPTLRPRACTGLVVQCEKINASSNKLCGSRYNMPPPPLLPLWAPKHLAPPSPPRLQTAT